MKIWIFLGAVNGFLGVAAGAVGSHVLSAQTTADQLALFKLAASYQLTHAFALLAAGLLTPYLIRPQGRALLKITGAAFTAGIILFCGALYMLATTGDRLPHAIAPIGGSLLMIGWLGLAVSAFFITPTAAEHSISGEEK